MAERTVFAEPRLVDNIADCYFYHTMDVPGYGHVQGQWDLRNREAEYLGNISLRGKRVLEIGTASGVLCFHMERQGAEVIAYDLSDKQDWDMVPYSRLGGEGRGRAVKERWEHIEKLNNGFWLAHRANKSQAKVIYGSVYEIPQEIGHVDISVFGSVLIHVRDPFRALERAAGLTRETIVVTDASSRRLEYLSGLLRTIGFRLPLMSFLPNYRTGEYSDTWWKLSPEIVKSFLGVLGFENSRVSHATYSNLWGKTKLFTVVAHRTG